MQMIDALPAVLRAHSTPAAQAWLDEAMARSARGDMSSLCRAYTDASRHLGRAPLDLARELPASADAFGGMPPSHWTLEDAGRLLLLLARYEASGPDAGTAAALECYEQGSTREQESWLRALPLLPEPERCLATAIDACRTSILPLFESIACENPYPATYFPERNFNQLVLKALFNGVALRRITGLAGRRNHDLSRMARDFAAERTAAGRPVPADIALAIVDAPDARPEAVGASGESSRNNGGAGESGATAQRTHP